MPRLKDFLPNPPHKGLPTPQGWGQTWDRLDKQLEESPGNILPLGIATFGGGFLGAAIGVGVGFPLSIGPALATSFTGIIAGIGTGLGLYGAVWKTLEGK